MKKEKIIVEITYNSKGLNEISVGDVSLEIEAIRGKSIQEWFTPFNGRVSWKGLIPEIKEAIQDDDAEFEFEFIGKPEFKNIFEECLKTKGLCSMNEDSWAKGVSVETNSYENSEMKNVDLTENNDSVSKNGNSLDEVVNVNLDEVFGKAKRLEIQGNKREALEQYMILAQCGHTEGEYKAAELRRKLLKDKGNKHSENEKYQIFLLFEAAANHGHVGAMKRLAECYKDAYGVDESPKYAAKWYKNAAVAGNTESIRYTGMCYEKGYGVKVDKKYAAKWYIQGIEKNDSESGLLLGRLYLSGDGIKKMKKRQCFT